MANQNENRDIMTGLWNRVYALAELERLVTKEAPVTLIFIDVDRFKTYQDAYGFGEGDKRLQEIARRVEENSGEGALVFRYGGDEFGVIFYECSLEAAREIAEKIRANRTPFPVKVGEKEVETLTLSIGIAHFPTHVSNAENLLRATELALIKAKGEGSSRLADGTHFTPRNRVMAIGDFWDDFPEQSAEFLR